jgi:hypothetical protein
VEYLKWLLKQNRMLYLFGDVGGRPGKGDGEFEVMNMFDKVYYLKASKAVIKRRLMTRKNNLFGKHQEELKGVLEYRKGELDSKAKKLGLKTIDASLPYKKIIKMITS